MGATLRIASLSGLTAEVERLGSLGSNSNWLAEALQIDVGASVTIATMS